MQSDNEEKKSNGYERKRNGYKTKSKNGDKKLRSGQRERGRKFILLSQGSSLRPLKLYQ